MRYFPFILLFLWIPIKVSAQRSTVSAQVATFNIEAPQLNSTKKIWIYLPKNYAISDKKLPVIYMHDAQNLFDQKTSYAGEWQVDETLDSMMAQVIVVGIEHDNDKRLEEMTPFPNEKYGGGKADSYLEFIVKTLKPHIDSSYRTKSNAKNTIIIGSSLGGLVSYYAILKYPKIFGKAGIFSPSFWFSEAIYDLTAKTPKIKTKLYFMCGDSESETMVADLNKMELLIHQKRCSSSNMTKKTIVNGGKHNEKLWRDGFSKAILWLGY